MLVTPHRSFYHEELLLHSLQGVRATQPFRQRALDAYAEVTALPVTALGSWGEAARNTAGSSDCYFPLSQCGK